MIGKFSPDLIEGQLVQDRGYRWKKCAQAMLRTLLPEIPLVRSCHEFNIAGPKQWPHTHALGAMYAGGARLMEVKVIRRSVSNGYRVAESQFYPKKLEAVELHYAPNHALRVTREELSEILNALQPDLEYRDGVIELIKTSERDSI
jgi:hypothetical protein